MLPISIVIPLYNEKKQIEVLLRSLSYQLGAQFADVEIIIINNGSYDISEQTAMKFYAKSFYIKKTSVGAARNYGASIAANEVLVFLDSDMEITKEWAHEIQNVSASLRENYYQITGNKVATPSNPNWIEKYWFCEIPDQKINYINSANLVISKKLFKKLNGFNGLLVSGEDYDLSMRALKLGADLKLNSKLIAIHHGYPKNIYAFIKREVWHGTSDFVDFRSILKSKVAIVSLIYILLHGIAVWSLFYFTAVALFASILIVMFLLLLLSIKKYSKLPLKYIVINTLVYYLYFMGRSLSFFKAILSR